MKKEYILCAATNRLEIGKDFTYIILDDDNDMLLEQKDHFVQCDNNDGFTNDKLI